MSSFLLQTSRTIIRPYSEADIERVAPIFSDPLTMAFWPEPFSRERIEGWVARAVAEHGRNGLGRMVVELRETGEVIGDCGVMESEVNGRQEYDLGYIIHHPWWRQGYAVECAAAALDYARGKGIERVVANMAYDHAGSERVAQRLGFRKEGEFTNIRNRGFRTLLYVVDGK